MTVPVLLRMILKAKGSVLVTSNLYLGWLARWFGKLSTLGTLYLDPSSVVNCERNDNVTVSWLLLHLTRHWLHTGRLTVTRVCEDLKDRIRTTRGKSVRDHRKPLKSFANNYQSDDSYSKSENIVAMFLGRKDDIFKIISKGSRCYSWQTNILAKGGLKWRPTDPEKKKLKIPTCTLLLPVQLTVIKNVFSEMHVEQMILWGNVIASIQFFEAIRISVNAVLMSPISKLF